MIGTWSPRTSRIFNGKFMILKKIYRFLVVVLISLVYGSIASSAEPTTADVRGFIRELVDYVRDHHIKKDRESPQNGMIYEYYDHTKPEREGGWIEGEALDSMHDGAWYSCALVQASRATNDPYYRDLVRDLPVPFYVNTLHHSDELFDPACDAYRGARLPEAWVKEHLLKAREKGFLPYFWDDGASVSLEASRRKNLGPALPACDELAGKPNPEHRLVGYALGSSNHLAQDLGVMLLQTWLFFHESNDIKERALADRIAEAARDLAASRLKRAGRIPAVVSALAPFDDDARRAIPEYHAWDPDNHYTRALHRFKPGERVSLPGFADDQEYFYYSTIARERGSLSRAAAQRIVYDAYTLPRLYRFWSDDAPVPAGMNRFDLHPFDARDGKMTEYRSDRKRPAGSRIGPQLMVISGWACQALREYPGLYDERYRIKFSSDARVNILDDDRDDPDAATIDLGEVKLRCVGRDSALDVQGDFTGERIETRFYSQPDRSGEFAVVTIEGDRPPTAINDRGERLIVERVLIKKVDTQTHFSYRLPYTVVKKQSRWANGIEHGRLSVSVGDRTRNLYLLSPENRVREALLREIEEGFRTWRAIFKDRGYIPTSLGAGAVADRRWDDLSDTGGYAHLISAMAQYLFFREGKCDWKEMKFPTAAGAKAR
jgi:hypothetical protein